MEEHNPALTAHGGGFQDGNTQLVFAGLVGFRLKSSASFTSRHRGTDRAAAIEWATFNVGFRWNRSIKEIIFGARSAFSAKDSCDKPFALRWFLTATPNALAKSFVRIPEFCQTKRTYLQEQLFQF
jgi:hypothetical protein